jgi:Domain of unknown function (DUF1707)
MCVQYPPKLNRRQQLPSAPVSALLVSDRDRENTVDLLRGHWLTGRLTADEFEQRVGEAWAARYTTDLWRALRSLPVEQPRALRRGSGAAALILSGIACCIMLFSFGFGFPLALPLFIAGWAAGREARRSNPGGASGVAAAGEALGIMGTIGCLLFIAGFVAIVT